MYKALMILAARPRSDLDLDTQQHDGEHESCHGWREC